MQPGCPTGSYWPWKIHSPIQVVLTVQTLPDGVLAAQEKTGCKIPGVLMDVIKKKLKINPSSSASYQCAPER